MPRPMRPAPRQAMAGSDVMAGTREVDAQTWCGAVPECASLRPGYALRSLKAPRSPDGAGGSRDSHEPPAYSGMLQVTAEIFAPNTSTKEGTAWLWRSRSFCKPFAQQFQQSAAIKPAQSEAFERPSAVREILAADRAAE